MKNVRRRDIPLKKLNAVERVVVQYTQDKISMMDVVIPELMKSDSHPDVQIIKDKISYKEFSKLSDNWKKMSRREKNSLFPMMDLVSDDQPFKEKIITQRAKITEQKRQTNMIASLFINAELETVNKVGIKNYKFPTSRLPDNGLLSNLKLRITEKFDKQINPGKIDTSPYNPGGAGDPVEGQPEFTTNTPGGAVGSESGAAPPPAPPAPPAPRHSVTIDYLDMPDRTEPGRNEFSIVSMWEDGNGSGAATITPIYYLRQGQFVNPHHPVYPLKDANGYLKITHWLTEHDGGYGALATSVSNFGNLLAAVPFGAEPTLLNHVGTAIELFGAFLSITNFFENDDLLDIWTHEWTTLPGVTTIAYHQKVGHHNGPFEINVNDKVTVV